MARMRRYIFRNLLFMFFGGKTNPKVFENKFKMSAADLEYFFVKESDLFEKATEEQLDIIGKYYPTL